MKPPRFSVRTMLVLVLLFGVASAVPVLWNRSSEFRRLADVYKALDEDAGRTVAYWSKKLAAPSEKSRSSGEAGAIDGSPPRDTGYYLEQIETDQRHQAIYRRTWLIYDRAARYPFLPLPPDQPEPE